MWRKKSKKLSGGDLALEEARRSLDEVQKERRDVEGISKFLKMHRTKNHWSQRLDILLRSTR